MHKYPETHPIWNILRTIVMFGGVALLVWVNESKFGWDEIKILLELMGIKAMFEVGKNQLCEKEETKNGSE